MWERLLVSPCLRKPFSLTETRFRRRRLRPWVSNLLTSSSHRDTLGNWCAPDQRARQALFRLGRRETASKWETVSRPSHANLISLKVTPKTNPPFHAEIRLNAKQMSVSTGGDRWKDREGSVGIEGPRGTAIYSSRFTLLLLHLGREL